MMMSRGSWGSFSSSIRTAANAVSWTDRDFARRSLPGSTVPVRTATTVRTTACAILPMIGMDSSQSIAMNFAERFKRCPRVKMSASSTQVFVPE